MKKILMVAITSIAIFLTSCSKEVDVQSPDILPNQTFNVDSGIIAKFLFRNNLVDATLYRNDGTTQNSSFEVDRFNQVNESLYSYDGFMESNNIPFNISKNYTITFWVKMMGFSEGAALLELNKNRRYDGNPQVWMSKNYLYLSQCNRTQNKLKIGYVPSMLNKWVNVTWTLYNGITILYVNGERIGVSDFIYPNYFGITLTLGNMGNNGSPYRSQPSDASLDDVKIYNRVLSESEIRYLSKN